MSLSKSSQHPSFEQKKAATSKEMPASKNAKL
jgi:hypothetical protein